MTARLARWLLFAIALLVGGVTAFFIFYHPPMRLMPAPLLWQDPTLPLSDIGPALARRLAHGVHEILVPVVDREIGAEPQAFRAFLGASGRREHPTAEGLGQLDRRRADA
jgi:hypothetical protein